MNMNEVLLLIGIMMTISGIIVFYLGYKRGVPNTILWAAFPILHGLHEFTEYFMDNFDLISYTERFEMLFSISGSFVLLAAALEYNGVLQKPVGKIAGLIGLIGVSYFVFGLPEELLEDIEHTIITVGIFKTDPIRFMQGMFLTILTLLVIIITYLYLLYQSKKGIITPDSKLSQTTIIAILLLGIYAFFEGFNWEGGIFISLRAISLGLFIVVPIFFILTNKIGLQRLIIIDEGGIPLMVFNFPSDSFLSFDSSEGSRVVLASGFLAAISSFSGQVLKAGSSLSLRTNNLFFIVSQYKSKIYALQTLHTNRNLEKKFDQLKEGISSKIENFTNPGDINTDDIKPVITEMFSFFY